MSPQSTASAASIIAALGLSAHPEGGHYRETFRDDRVDSGGRSVSTAIYYLLAAGEMSRWHRVDAAEVWHWYAGAPLLLQTTGDLADASPKCHWLGPDLVAGQRPQFVVPTGVWQQARCDGAWALCGCTVAPGFEFAGFEMAPTP